jgi:hypothetical protein
MAGFEVVVRPAVFPNIRPAPARSLPPADDPTKGFCEITGGGSFPVQLSFSQTVSTSKSKPVEMERRSDEVRIYQENDDGTVNRDNYVDMKVANRIKMKRQEGDPVPPSAGDTGGVGGGPLPRPKRVDIDEVSYYQRLKESNNVEIRKTDIIDKSSLPGSSE